jgi:hypothetical protein
MIRLAKCVAQIDVYPREEYDRLEEPISRQFGSGSTGEYHTRFHEEL